METGLVRVPRHALVMNDALPVSDLDPPKDGPGGRRTVPVLWIVVGALLVASTVAAVLSGGERRSPSERLAAAPGAVEAAGTFAYEITIESDLGTIDNVVAVAGRADVAEQRSAATTEVMGRSFEMVSEGQSLYLRLPDAARAANGGKGWAKVDLGSGVPGGMTGGLGSTNPLDSFEQLRKAGSEVEDLGEEEVRGTSTRHLRTVLDLTDAIAELGAAGAPGADAIGPLRDQLSAVPVDVWLDDDDRIRRQRTTLDLSLPGVGSVEVRTTLEAFAYGEPVDIELPAPEDVVEAGPEILGSLFAG